ncbi:hypothetical protein BD289DRAFT_154709 [Coniella lustricola]|uniref:Uncharacterized protein n=1 Tax=Coniella lustricola TaxID=2025994 RepID=A0A2T3AME0_9PEZI|nr:hypothetical protein BD289DRAFT_154709 [Coniella lustricola]
MPYQQVGCVYWSRNGTPIEIIQGTQIVYSTQGYIHIEEFGDDGYNFESGFGFRCCFHFLPSFSPRLFSIHFYSVLPFFLPFLSPTPRFFLFLFLFLFSLSVFLFSLSHIREDGM